jgi:4,5-dihydroxyphthalate decarboxylase
MANLKLTLACWDYDRTRPLADGTIKAEGIDLEVKLLRPRDMFPRMLEKREFDASELSLASYTALIGRNQCPFVAIPVAVSKFFRHGCIYIRRDANIKSPHDLRGKRIGTTQYSSTAATYMRGMLRDDYGIDAKDIHWFMGGLTKPTEAPLIPLDLPSDIRLDYVPAGDTLERMMRESRLDALMSIYIPTLMAEGWPNIERLFIDFKNVEQDYYTRTGIFPIMHTVALRDDIVAKHPWVPQSLYKAFCDARDEAIKGLWDTDALRLSLPWLIDHIEENWRIFGKDFWAYGMKANRPALEAVGRYVHEQGFSPRPVTAAEIWPILRDDV